MIYHREFRLSIKWLKRASSKLNKPFCLPCKGCGSPVETSAQSAEAPTESTGETVGATCCTRRDCEKMAWTSSPSHFCAFCLLFGGQYHRTAPAHKIQNLSHFLKVYQRVEIYNLHFSTRWGNE